jgi:prepilin-type N-terminal cleavage/methylation domain-containing protein
MRWRRLGVLTRERGFTLIEMLVVMVVMGVVTTALTTLFVSASNSELDMNNRFQAQINARLALDKVRREVHCASDASPTTQSSTVTITLQSYCKTGSGSVTWCTRSVSTNRYALYRIAGNPGTCTGGVKWADYLVPSSSAPTCGTPTALCVFNYTAQSTSSLAKLGVDFPVNVRSSKPVETYELQDSIVLRNSTRS